MSIRKQILYELVWEGINARRKALCPWTCVPWAQSVDYDFMDYLLRIILFRDPVRDCLVIGDESDWEGFPASKSLRLSCNPDIGLPIGDLTSQLFSNVYLNPLDQFIKRQLRCRHYGRYVDDAYIIHTDLRYLETLVPAIEDFLLGRLKLRLHPHKIRITSVDYGIPFLGAVIKPFRTYVAGRTVRSFHSKIFSWEQKCLQRRLTEQEVEMLLQVINSYCGYFSHFKTFRILQKQFCHSPVRRYVMFSGGFKKAEQRSRSRRIIPFVKDQLLFGEWQ